MHCNKLYIKELGFIILKRYFLMDKKVYEIKVIPSSKTNEVFEENGILKAKLKAKAEKGEANKALIVLLEKHFKSKVTLLRGHTSHKKIVLVE